MNNINYFKLEQKEVSKNNNIYFYKIKNTKPAIILNENENYNFFLNYNNEATQKEILNKYDYFRNINNFQFPINKIGKTSSNGFNSLIKIKNNIDTNNFDLVLKVSKKKKADNNYYEFYVGKCINYLKQYIPNFVYTFQHLFLSNELVKDISNNYAEKIIYNNTKKIFNKDNIKFSSINDNLNNILENNKLKEGCSNNDRSGVFIESVHNSLSWDDLFLINKCDFLNNLDYNMFCILFQIYAGLFILRNKFTHYDLHTGNIIFIYLDKPIKIIYNDEKNYVIYTRYIPVIIDYGRSYINCKDLFNNNLNSNDFINSACDISECNSNDVDNCNLINIGLYIKKFKGFFSDNHYYYHINPRTNNKSHDLRYIYDILKLKDININNASKRYNKKYNCIILNLINLYFNSFKNPEWEKVYDEYGTIYGYYGVKEFNDAFENDSPGIKTVSDLYKLLKLFYNDHQKNYSEERNKVTNILGTLNIYNDLITKWSFSYSNNFIIPNTHNYQYKKDYTFRNDKYTVYYDKNNTIYQVDYTKNGLLKTFKIDDEISCSATWTNGFITGFEIKSYNYKNDKECCYVQVIGKPKPKPGNEKQSWSIALSSDCNIISTVGSTTAAPTATIPIVNPPVKTTTATATATQIVNPPVKTTTATQIANPPVEITTATPATATQIVNPPVEITTATPATATQIVNPPVETTTAAPATAAPIPSGIPIDLTERRMPITIDCPIKKTENKYSILFYHIGESGDIYIYKIGNNFLFDKLYKGTFSFGLSIIRNVITNNKNIIQTIKENKIISNHVLPINLNFKDDAPSLFWRILQNYKISGPNSNELIDGCCFNLVKLVNEDKFKINEKITGSQQPYLTGKKYKIIHKIEKNINYVDIEELEDNFITFTQEELDVFKHFNNKKEDFKTYNKVKMDKEQVDRNNIIYDIIKFNI